MNHIRNIVLLLVLVLTGVPLYAEERSIEEMKIIAEGVFPLPPSSNGLKRNKVHAEVVNRKEALTVIGTAGGLVIISNDDAYEPILGYIEVGVVERTAPEGNATLYVPYGTRVKYENTNY